MQGIRPYFTGFLLSLILTFASFLLVYESLLTGWPLIYSLSGLALTQMIVQLIFFLHLGDEPKPYWNLLLFLFMVLTLVILIGGSLWIMYNLDYQHISHK